VEATVFHAAFETDPHPIADKLTAYWEGEGFTVTRTVDWTDPADGEMDISIRATRPDGVYYGLTATHDLVSIDVSTECSTHPSIQAWAERRLQERFDELHATLTPAPTPATDLGEGAADTGNPDAAAAITDPSNLFREFHEDASDDPAPTAASDPTETILEHHDDEDKHSPPPTTKGTANDYDWLW
jgi:hypothetical protein